MSRYTSNEIATSRQIRVDRNKANYLRTKGIINRTAMCTTDILVNIGEIPFGIANKINKYCNMEVYAESKWNLVQCMDNRELKRVFLAPKEIQKDERIETSDSTITGDSMGDNDDIDTVSTDIIPDDNTGDMESSELDSEEVGDDAIEENGEEPAGELEEELDEEEELSEEDAVDDGEEVITRSSSTEDVEEDHQDETVTLPVRPNNNNYNKYNKHNIKRRK